MNPNFKNKFTKTLQEQIDNAQSAIVGGSLTIEEYKTQCGYLNGLKDTLRLFEETLQEYYKKEGIEDLEQPWN